MLFFTKLFDVICCKSDGGAAAEAHEGNFNIKLIFKEVGHLGNISGSCAKVFNKTGILVDFFGFLPKRTQHLSMIFSTACSRTVIFHYSSAIFFQVSLDTDNNIVYNIFDRNNVAKNKV